MGEVILISHADTLEAYPLDSGRRPHRSNVGRCDRMDPASRNVVLLGPALNRGWVTDITYVWTDEGWLYLAAILDLFSRRVVAVREMRVGG